MDFLGTLFGSQSRVKILRLFLLNQTDIFEIGDIVRKSKVRLSEVRKEINLLKKAGIIEAKDFIKEVEVKQGSKKTISKRQAKGVRLDIKFPLLAPLKNLIVSETPLNHDEIGKRFRTAGKIKFLALSGIFLGEPDSRVDVFIVGDNLSKRAIESALRSIEAEIGKELSYGVLDTAEFLYRISVYDKFVRDILDFRHDRIIDKLGVV